jgi:hypothetical protein
MILARNSIGNVARIGCKGSWISSGLAETGGVTEFDGGGCEPDGIGMGANGSMASGREVFVGTVSLSSAKRRNRPRNNPVNFILTALMCFADDRPSGRSHGDFSTNRATVCFLFDFAIRCFISDNWA